MFDERNDRKINERIIQSDEFTSFASFASWRNEYVRIYTIVHKYIFGQFEVIANMQGTNECF